MKSFIITLGLAALVASAAAQCGTDEFQCVDTGECIPYDDQCDAWPDCSDGSDEDNCPLCDDTSFICVNGECIPGQWVCDGDNDCGDLSDEVDCPCDEGEVHCANGQCILEEFWCDAEGIFDCGDHSDVTNCTTSAPAPVVTATVRQPKPYVFGNSKLVRNDPIRKAAILAKLGKQKPSTN